MPHTDQQKPRRDRYRFSLNLTLTLRLENDMKVSELIAELECYDGDAEVHMAYGAGDYWRTTLAPMVARTFQGTVQKSEYHQTDRLYERDLDEPEDEEDEPIRRVVVIE